MEELDALIARVVEVANEVLQEKRTPYDGAKELWRLSSAMWELPDALLPFVLPQSGKTIRLTERSSTMTSRSRWSASDAASAPEDRTESVGRHCRTLAHAALVVLD